MYSRKLYLVTSSLAVAGMVFSPVFAPTQSYAQAPGPNAAGDSGDAQDPPARVGRLAIVEGTVSFHPESDDHWSPAVLNTPVTNGDSYWTEPQALAKIEVTGSAVWMNEQTEFDLTTLDDASMHASEPQGEVYMHLSSLQPSETYTLETPRGTVTMAADGRYDIVAGDTEHPTTITVLDGAAQITGNNISLQVHANQTASITGSTTFEGSVGLISQDDFLAAMLKREAPVASQSSNAPPLVAEMTGGQDLSQYGSWDTSAQYGNVWYPQVDNDYVPYRDGRWSYNAPWGWTWVDNAPWGFAPFHYGRWVQVGPRWGWAPGYPGYGGRERPVYAPALVSFFGAGVGVGIGVGFGVGIGGNVGWVPLGFGEPYYPSYRASRGYYSRVNIVNIRNVTNIYNERNTRGQFAIDRFANNRGATIVSARAMANSESIRGAGRRPNAAELASGRPFVDRAPVAPTGRTMGLTPRVAERLNVKGVEHRTAPGPQVVRGPDARGSRAALPVLREGRGVNARPASPAALQAAHGPAMSGGPGAARPGAPGPDIRRQGGPGGLPGLRQPGERPNQPGGLNRPGAEQRPNGEARPGAPGNAAPGPRIAPGPQIDRPGNAPGAVGGHPALRAPGTAPADHGMMRREAPPARAAREPDASPHGPEAARPAASPTVHQRPAEANRAPRPEPQHAAPAPRPQPEHAQPRPQPERAQPRPEPAARPRMEAPHAMPQAQRPEPRPMPQAPRPMPQAPRPEPRPMPQAPRPAPQAPHGAPPHPGGGDKRPH